VLIVCQEYLGDWINLLGHQKAAYEILTELFTPATIMQTELTRVILGWYARFDVFAGLMGGFETVLSREWFSSCLDFFQAQANNEPANLNWKIEVACADLRLIAMDISILFAKMGKGEVGLEQFMVDNERVSRRIFDWNDKMHPSLRDPAFLVTDFSGARNLDPNDIVNPYLPGTLFHGALWTMNLCMIDWYSLDLMHKYQTALMLQTQPDQELGMISYVMCQLFEAIEYWPHARSGSLLGCQAGIGIATLFLPRDERHNMWCRRKFAIIEANGYIWPTTFRTKMSALFQDSSCLHWWLPNDEAYPLIIRSIRAFVDERTAPAKDIPTEDLRDMKAIFSNLKLQDSSDSAPSSTGLRSGTPRKENETDVTVAGDESWVVPGAEGQLGSMTKEDFETDFDDGSAIGYWGGQGGQHVKER
jgi:hypothetical protein